MTIAAALLRPVWAWLHRPRGWVRDLLDQAPTIAARNVLDDLDEIEDSYLTAAETDARACARYVIEVPASRWDHEPVSLRRQWSRWRRRRRATKA